MTPEPRLLEASICTTDGRTFLITSWYSFWRSPTGREAEVDVVGWAGESDFVPEQLLTRATAQTPVVRGSSRWRTRLREWDASMSELLLLAPLGAC